MSNNIERVERLVEAFQAKDLDGVLSLLAPDIY